MLVRLDRAGTSARLGATPIEVTPEGFRVYRGTAAFGDVVYEYPEKGRNEYVPAAEALAPDIVSTIVGKPFTIHHPDDLLTADAPDDVKEHVEGTVRAARANLEKSPPELEVEVVVWTRPAQEDIESGAVVELSPGYFCEEDDAPANAVGPGGKPFQTIQRRRQYNHLSGVMRARGVTPDGRRARLDGAAAADQQPLRIVTGTAVNAAPEQHADGVYIADWAGPFMPNDDHFDASRLELNFGDDGRVTGSLNGAESMSVVPAPESWLAALQSGKRLLVPADDLGPLPEVGDAGPYPQPADPEVSMTAPAADTKPAPMPLTAAPADMDPAEALSAFSPEAAEILKSLPPDDLTILMQMAVNRKAEAAEHAVEAEAEAAGIPLVQPEVGEAVADQPKIEVEVEPASEGEEETEGAEGGPDMPAGGAGSEDATLPMAGQGLTDAPAPAAAAPVTQGDLAAAIDALGNKMIEMMNAAMSAAGKAAKTDGKPVAPAPAAKPKANADAARLDAERVAGEAAFVAAVRKAGHRVDAYPEAALKAVAVVKDHASPALAKLAADAAKDGRRADLLALFEDAEARRRDALVGEQFNALRLVVDAEDNYRTDASPTGGGNPSAPLPPYLPIPGAARAAK